MNVRILKAAGTQSRHQTLIGPSASPDGTLVAGMLAASQNGATSTLVVCDASMSVRHASRYVREHWTVSAFSPDGRYVAFGTSSSADYHLSGHLYLHDVGTKRWQAILHPGVQCAPSALRWKAPDSLLVEVVWSEYADGHARAGGAPVEFLEIRHHDARWRVVDRGPGHIGLGPPSTLRAVVPDVPRNPPTGVVGLHGCPDGSFVAYFADGWLEGWSRTGQRRWSCRPRGTHVRSTGLGDVVHARRRMGDDAVVRIADGTCLGTPFADHDLTQAADGSILAMKLITLEAGGDGANPWGTVVTSIDPDLRVVASGIDGDHLWQPALNGARDHIVYRLHRTGAASLDRLPPGAEPAGAVALAAIGRPVAGPGCLLSEEPFSFVTVEIEGDGAVLVGRRGSDAAPLWEISFPARPSTVTPDPLGLGVLILEPDGSLSAVSPAGRIAPRPYATSLKDQGRATAVTTANHLLVLGTDLGAVVLVEAAPPRTGAAPGEHR